MRIGIVLMFLPYYLLLTSLTVWSLAVAESVFGLFGNIFPAEGDFGRISFVSLAEDAFAFSVPDCVHYNEYCHVLTIYLFTRHLCTHTQATESRFLCSLCRYGPSLQV